ncbi:MAG: Ig-like domain-containing protein, partial [Ginsengibacter sp.]
ALSNIPKDVRISNVTNDAFTVSYVTDGSVNGSLSFGQDIKLGNVAFDTRDIKSPAPHSVHYITVKNLTASTKYLFTIVSADSTFQKNSVPYEVTTSTATSASSSAQININGKVNLEDGTAPPEALAYISSDDSASPSAGLQLLSTLIKPDGSYSLKFDNILNKDLTKTLGPFENTTLHMTLLNSTLTSSVSFLTDQADPLPNIILSRDYDFTLSNDPLSPTPATESAQITGFPPSENSTESATPNILTPKIDQEFRDQQPTFQGTALPNTDVELTIQSDQEITTTVQSDANGQWKYRPDTALSPGNHTLTVKTPDASGILRTLTQSFTVFAQGSQFTEPSISPSSTPTASPTPQPTIAQPTPTSSPSASPTPSPTISFASPTIASLSASPSPQITTPPIPKSGSSAVIFGLFGISFVVGLGSLLFFLL